MTKDRLFQTITEQGDRLGDLARELWAEPELALREREASITFAKEAEREGFTVDLGIGPMETAMTATYGAGSPTVGVLGEYDALPGMSQAVSEKEEPIEEGAPGHGCGHNLLGVGSFGGAVAVKRAIENRDLAGTIRFYGCPAEEGGIGKVFMAREGAFDDLDVALCWHPWHVSAPWRRNSLAADSFMYEYTGTSAHAASAPEAGRSGVDALQLLNTGLEFMREHLPTEAKLHYAIRDGGEYPNTVPAHGSAHYFVRSPTRDQVRRISAWVDDAAEGAGLMTQTTPEKTFFTGTYEFLPNETITDIVFENMQELGPIDYTDDDRAFAASLQDKFDPETIESRLGPLSEDYRAAIEGQSLHSTPLDVYPADELLPVSTDVGNVSWIVPTAQFWVATWPVGTPPHTWQAVAANGSFGIQGAVYAAKVIAGTVYDMMSDPSIGRAAGEEFDRATASTGYESPLPEDRTAPILPESFAD